MGCGPVRGCREQEQEQQNRDDGSRGPGEALPAARLRGYLIIFTGGGGMTLKVLP